MPNEKVKMIVTDLDGTLFNAEGIISDTNLETLRQLRDSGNISVIATGRSLYSSLKSLPPDLPIDYLVCSTGACIYNWKNHQILKSYNLNSSEVKQVYGLLMKLKLDFIIQEAAPENHKCHYVKHSEENKDLENRNELYKTFSKKLDVNHFFPKESCQFIVIFDGNESVNCYDYIKNNLKNLKVIRTTSPLNHTSLWIEIYPSEVSKAKGIEFISTMHGIEINNIMTLGNDYNDRDMLLLTKNAFVVNNAPEDLKKEFYTVSDHNQHGFSEAVEIFLTKPI